MTQHTFERRFVIGDRPANVPADALIFNAPRPIQATMTADGPFIWQADFNKGVFYAAVLPGDPERALWIKFNREMDASLLVYVSADEAKTLVRNQVIAYLAQRPTAKLPGTLDEYIADNWEDRFYHRYARSKVTVDSDSLAVVEVE